MTAPLIRLGLPLPGGALPKAAAELGASLLVSANAMAIYRKDSHGVRVFERFRTSLPDLDGLDVALDSAGFTAWAHYGDFPWTVEAYVRLAACRPWAWWAQMDACCEPEIARSPDAVRLRQAETIRLLHECRRESARVGIQDPMPVLQGWTPADYVWHADQLDLRAESMVGVGSVCRRHVWGPNGLVAVVDALDRCLPDGVALHLFGVKSEGMSVLALHPRVASVDSMAWDVEARRIGRMSGGCTMRVRTTAMRHWYERQLDSVAVAGGVPGALPLDTIMPPEASIAASEWAELVAAGEVDVMAASRFALLDAALGDDE